MGAVWLCCQLLAGVEDQAGAQRKAEKDAEAAKRYAIVGGVGGKGWQCMAGVDGGCTYDKPLPSMVMQPQCDQAAHMLPTPVTCAIKMGPTRPRISLSLSAPKVLMLLWRAVLHHTVKCKAIGA
jgi:hypothetical protein